MKGMGKMHQMHIEKIELTQLRLIEAIVEHGNLSFAAEVVGLSQSAASHSLARLRKETGDLLFVRTSQRMEPTSFGQQLAAAAHNALLLLHHSQLTTTNLLGFGLGFGEGMGVGVGLGAVTDISKIV